MVWPSVSAREALTRLRAGAKALDVRSPGEFAHGFIAGFANIPILNDEHRHLVGLTYQEQGQQAAIDLGLKLVTPLKPDLLQSWREILDGVPSEQRLLICWRGGLRSKIAAEWLGEGGFAGLRVEGGYKALRAELLDAFKTLPELVVLGGLTGSGKTDLLRRLPREKFLDLEFLANHRGSSFGLRMHAQQPAQATFENSVALELTFTGPVMAVEAESRMVGNCLVPAPVKVAMDAAPLILLESTMEERVQRIFAEYVREPLQWNSAAEVLAHLQAALARVQKRLGGLRYQAIKSQLDGAFLVRELKEEKHAPWIESLLREYYDPQYEFAFQNKGRKVHFRGNAREVEAYLAYRLDRRRS